MSSAVGKVGMILPILPGRTQAVKSFHSSWKGALEEEYLESRGTVGVHREIHWVVETSCGDWLVWFLEGQKVHSFAHSVSYSSLPFDLLCRQRAMKDFAFDMTSMTSVSELVVDWHDGSSGKFLFPFFLQIQSGRMERWSEFIDNYFQRGHTESRSSAGIHRESIFLESSFDKNFAITFLEVDCIEDAVKSLAEGTSNYHSWFRSNLLQIHGLDMEVTKPIQPRLIFSWSKGDSQLHGRTCEREKIVTDNCSCKSSAFQNQRAKCIFCSAALV